VNNHEARRFAVYKQLNDLYLKPVEINGAEVGKCGWVCKDSYDAAEEVIEDYIDEIQKKAIKYFNENNERMQKIIGEERLTLDNPRKDIPNITGYQDLSRLLEMIPPKQPQWPNCDE